MNCRTLEYVVAVKELGSVQLASQHCNASPGTVSGQITSLEKYLGITLFASRKYPAQLHPQAEDLYNDIGLLSEVL